MDELELQLRQVGNLSPVDVQRILFVGRTDDGRSLEKIAAEEGENLGYSSVHTINRSLRKLYNNSEEAPGISSLDDLRKWMRGETRDALVPLETVNVVEAFTGLTTAHRVVFVYGSLADPKSLGQTIREMPSLIQYVPAELENHVSGWGADSRRLNYSSGEWESLDHVWWLWLTIHRTGNPSNVVPGALIMLRDSQYRHVRDRESHYDERIVTDDVRVDGNPVSTPLGSQFGDIITFAPPDLPRISASQTGLNRAVRAGYYNRVDRYLSRIHSGKEIQLPGLPDNVHQLEGYPTDDQVFEEYWSNIPPNNLNNHWFSLDSMLYRKGVTRQTAGGGKESIPFIPKPLILNQTTYGMVSEAAEDAVSLMAKTHEVVLSKANQKLFDLNRYTDFDRELSDKSLANHRSDSTNLPVVARVDFGLRGDQLKIFEVNTDSPAGAFHLDWLADLQWKSIKSRHLTGDLVDVLEPPTGRKVCEAVTDAFFKHWKLYRDRAEKLGLKPKMRRIAIVDKDVRNAAAYSEFENFQRLLSRNGVRVSIVDAEDLDYRPDSKELVDGDGRPIDAVYKRLLWQEAIDLGMGGRNDPLCRAYLDNAVFVMNSFLSRLAGSKLNLAIAKTDVFEAQCAAIGRDLTPSERKTLETHIPDTLMWGPTELDDRPATTLRDRVMDNITNWVLKEFHGKGGQEFIDGSTSQDVLPVARFNAAWVDQRFIAQEHQAHGLNNVLLRDNPAEGVTWDRYPFILGAYVIDGECVAIEAKTDSSIPININQGGRRTAVFSLRR